MTADTWQQVREVFGAAMALSGAERAAYLAAFPEAVRREVESLLEADGRAGEFLQSEAGAVPVGSRLGPYRILEKIGEGGMGAVYLARRDLADFEQQVALKVVSGALATEEMDRRFLAERQTLARLTHPNIVRLLDGGEWEGRRYFAMEFVTGVPITSYCRDLPVATKLAMFRTVCGAIHYAHQHLIVHRDIKPANILVTVDGEVKVLDFGIAKLLDSAADAGATTRLHPMSLDCASPEQVKGLPTTTATDVYALGVLVYELLAGVTPQGGPGRTLDETIRRICELPPERPSTFKRDLAQDLDSIVLRAMQKDPQLRYGSAEELSADVGRFLDGRPVAAREATFSYVARKFVVRHRAPVAAAVCGAVLLIGGSGVVFWQSRVVARERALAQRRFEETRKLARSVIFDLQSQLAALPGTLPVRKKMIEQTVSYLESMARDAGDSPALLLDIAGSYLRVGMVQGLTGDSNLGDVQSAVRSWETALRLVDRALAKEPRNKEALNLASSLHGRLAGVKGLAGKKSESAAHLDRAVEMAARLKAIDPDSAASAEVMGGAMFARAMGLETDAQVRAFEETLAVYETILQRDPGSLNKMRNVALCCKYLASRLEEQGDVPRALPYAIRARKLDEERLARMPRDRGVLVDLSNDLGTIGNFQRDLGNFQEAIGIGRRNLELRKQMAAEDPNDAMLQERLAMAHQSLGLAYVGGSDGRAARTELYAALAGFQALRAAAQFGDYELLPVSVNQYGLAKAAKLLHDRKAACGFFVDARAGLRRVFASNGKSKQAESILREIDEALTECQEATGR